MRWFKDINNREIRLTNERQEHFETEHPEMPGKIGKMRDTLLNPDRIVRSLTDQEVELFYRLYDATPVTQKYLCVVVKVLFDDLFIITAYFTDAVKGGEILWEKR